MTMAMTYPAFGFDIFTASTPVAAPESRALHWNLLHLPDNSLHLSKQGTIELILLLRWIVGIKNPIGMEKAHHPSLKPLSMKHGCFSIDFLPAYLFQT